MDNIKINEKIEKKLEKFYNLHLNCKINLTAIKERQEFYYKHYYDSIYYFQKYFHFDSNKEYYLADIGSGGGFPGVVLSIFYPNLKVTLIESIGKKCKFLEEVIRELDLQNTEVINSRVENIKNRSFDIITARGVAAVKDILKNSLHISNKNTIWILYKGEKLGDEIKEATSLITKWSLQVEHIRIEEPITRTYCIINY